MHDLIIRNGSVVDGTGRPAISADIAIDGERIVIVGKVAGVGREEIDAAGAIVTPGFVDIHTHYDAQATWDPILAPSALHGVTSAVIGNCGVGFAPAAPSKRHQLMEMMEGVEGIPSAALEAGMPWDWESFPEFLDALDRMPRTIDIGTHVPHAAVRNYVMGERQWDKSAGPEDLTAMAAIVEDGVREGALGFSTNLNPGHCDLAGRPIPGTYSQLDEWLAFGEALHRVGYGVFEFAGNPVDLASESDWKMMSEVSRKTGVTMSYTLVQLHSKPHEWRTLLARTDEENKKGASIRAQIALRSIATNLGWRASNHPFSTRPSWIRISDKSWPEQFAALRDPAFKAQLLAESNARPSVDMGERTDIMLTGWDRQYPVESNPNYEPGPDASVQGIADAIHKDPAEVAYDAMMEHDGGGLLYTPLLNYAGGNLEDVRQMLEHPATVVSLSDGGAHVQALCDGASPTFMLTHWARDRKAGSGPVPLVQAIKWQTSDTASLYGLLDRGRLEPNLLADINIIDLSRLKLGMPYLASDLPAGCSRFLQKADGYAATIKSGVVTFRDGEPTGARPGRVIRGARTRYIGSRARGSLIPAAER
jgi:N-acyl-D-amino-acid deacylase